MTVVAAVQQTDLHTAVVTVEAFKAITFTVYTAPLVLTVVGTLRFCAVGAPPSRLTCAAAGFSTPVAMAVAVGLCGNLPLNKERQGKCIKNYQEITSN